jgi:hypothetical protein
MTGTVLVAREAGFAEGARGADLTAGERVITGEASSATLLVAERCSLPLAALSIVTLSEVDGCACAMVSSNAGPVGAQADNGRGGGGAALPLTAFIGSLIPVFAAVGGEIAEGSPSSCDNSVSPPAPNACPVLP